MFVKRREFPRNKPVTRDMLVKQYSSFGNTSMEERSPMGRRAYSNERSALVAPVDLATGLMYRGNNSSLFGSQTRRTDFSAINKRRSLEDADGNGVPDMYEYNLKQRSPFGSSSMTARSPMGSRSISNERLALVTPVDLATGLMYRGNNSSMFGSQTRQTNFSAINKRRSLEDADGDSVPDIFEYNLKNRKGGKASFPRCPNCGAMLQDEY